ncbi:hypothetical protein [Paenisporosarcina antarctica]|uniref:DUF3951 domain-containing protein n=1 Tax=Paenisporosarcina antarctica TaxID=417367 RepID=A0A4P7A273_9BACL|nr:hypothetical protein [Paenisporosarcina antarctica]QBP42823.1 hypothetical protein E2636_17490 [Paenisporosarcina antarctica]
MGYIILAMLIGVICWTLWRLFNHRRLPLNFFTPFNDAMEGKKDDSNSTALQDTKHQVEYEETTPKKEQ